MNRALYVIWKGIWQRCTNPKFQYYADYGGRGISVCEEWKSFETFAADMGDRPPGLTIERVDNDLGYCKNNCRWATRSDQARNRRSTRLVTHNGRTQTMIAWAEELGISYMALYLRLYRRNLPVAEALRPGKPEPKRVGELNNKAKLTGAQVQEIRRVFAGGSVTKRELARKHGVSPSVITNVIARKIWRHVA